MTLDGSVHAECAITRDLVPSLCEVAYAAGLFEGEGCVTIRWSPARSGRGQFWLAVVVKMVDREPLDALSATWGGSVLSGGESRPGRSQSWQWCLYSRRAADFLASIEPHLLSEKRRRAVALAIAFQAQKRSDAYCRTDEYRAEQATFRRDLQRLNQRAAA